MFCEKNGVGADYGNGYIYISNRFECRKCGIQILTTNNIAILDIEHKTQKEYLDIKG
jgi:hypothetical protein